MAATKELKSISKITDDQLSEIGAIVFNLTNKIELAERGAYILYQHFDGLPFNSTSISASDKKECENICAKEIIAISDYLRLNGYAKQPKELLEYKPHNMDQWANYMIEKADYIVNNIAGGENWNRIQLRDKVTETFVDIAIHVQNDLKSSIPSTNQQINNGMVAIDLNQFDGHTPGPWEYDEERQNVDTNKCVIGAIFSTKDDWAVAEICDLDEDLKSKDVERSNARLIAAAPLLLEEVKRLSSLERFQMPTDDQIVKSALLFNDGKIEKEKLSDMVALCDFVISRLHENGDILIPSSKE